MCDSTVVCFFLTIFSEPMKKQRLILHHIAILTSLESFNGSDLANWAHRNKKLIFWDLNLCPNISKFMTNKWLQFDVIAIYNLIIVISGSDIDYGIQIV